jgi:hypothetical protein
MKKTALIIFTAFLYMSCDYIAEPVPPRNSSGWDSVLCPQPQFPFIASHQRKVLLEEYTGRKCGNCPEGSHEADSIVQLYGSKVVSITIHSGYFAKPDASVNYSYDMRSATGTIYDDFFKVGYLGNPNGMVNRIDYDPNTFSHVKAFTTWRSNVASQLNLAPEADISIIADYNSTASKICLHIRSEFLTALSDNYRLVLLVTEDSLKKTQKDYSLPSPSDDTSYIHRNVLRDAINGTWGESIGSEAISAGDVFINNYTYPLTSPWNVQQLYIVAYIYDTATYRILQAAQQKVQ